MVLVLCLNRSLPVGFKLVTLSKFNSHFFFLFSFVLLRRKSRGRSKVRQHAQIVSALRLLLRLKLTAVFSTQHCNNIKFYSPVKAELSNLLYWNMGIKNDGFYVYGTHNVLDKVGVILLL